jgi:hypothetical protein
MLLFGKCNHCCSQLCQISVLFSCYVCIDNDMLPSISLEDYLRSLCDVNNIVGNFAFGKSQLLYFNNKKISRAIQFPCF